MLVIPYNPKVHKDEIIGLLQSHGMHPGLIEDLPEIGLIAIHQDMYVAAGFIRRIEGPYGMLDSYITKSDAPTELRDKALDMITYKLIKIAREGGAVKLLAFSGVENIITRAEKHGFVQIDYKVALLSL